VKNGAENHKWLQLNRLINVLHVNINTVNENTKITKHMSMSSIQMPRQNHAIKSFGNCNVKKTIMYENVCKESDVKVCNFN